MHVLHSNNPPLLLPTHRVWHPTHTPTHTHSTYYAQVDESQLGRALDGLMREGLLAQVCVGVCVLVLSFFGVVHGVLVLGAGLEFRVPVASCPST